MFLEFDIQSVNWLHACISTTSFSVIINGSLRGHFNGEKGLRKGDPLKSYIFVVVMEVLSCSLNVAAAEGSLPYHPRCKKVFFNSSLFC
jgi:hypothetical protein